MTEPPEAVVVDTNVLGWLLEGRHDSLTEQYRERIGARRIVVPFQVVAEIRFGMQLARWGELRVRRTERALSQLLVGQPDDQMISIYARTRSWGVEHGHPIGHKAHDGDRWIAATALRLGRSLVSHDGVFQRIEGLDLITLLGPR